MVEGGKVYRPEKAMAEDHTRQRLYYEAQLTTARDMWAYFRRIAAENEAQSKVERKRTAQVREKYRAMKADFDRLRREYAALEARCNELDSRLRRVLCSRTWRVMEPIRLVGRTMRKLRPRNWRRR